MMPTTITWLGEDHLHRDGNGPRFNIWNGVRFEIGKPVDLATIREVEVERISEVLVPGKERGTVTEKIEHVRQPFLSETAKHMLTKARVNPFYHVDDDDDDDDDNDNDNSIADSDQAMPVKRKRGRPPKVRTEP